MVFTSLLGGVGGAISEWWDNTIQSVLGGMYNGLYNKSNQIFTGMFGFLDERIQWAAGEITTQPQSWNSSAFTLVESIAENTLMPIAGCILTFIFCWQLVHMVQDSNRMQNIKAENILFVLICLGLCVAACANSFKIVMGIFEIGAEASKRLVGSSTIGSFGEGISFENVLPHITENYQFGDVIDALIALLVLWLSKLLIAAVAAIIYARINLWFIELLLYSSTAPIPFATFGNKEWGQIGMNYIRKMLAKGFEGFFMLLAFALFGAVLSGIGTGTGDFYDKMVMVIATGFSLCMLLFKAGNISESIFNAH